MSLSQPLSPSAPQPLIPSATQPHHFKTKIKIPASFNEYILCESQPAIDRLSLPVVIASTVQSQHRSQGLLSAGNKRKGVGKHAGRCKKKIGLNGTGFIVSPSTREAPKMYRPGELRTVMQPHLFDVNDESNLLAHMIGGGHGFRLQPLQHIIRTCPVQLREALIQTMSAMKLVMMNRAQFAQLNHPKSKMLRHLVARLPARKANRLVMPDEVRNPSVPEQLPGTTTTMLPFYVRMVDDDYADYPYICEVRDLTTFRRVGMCFNREMCEVFGLSPEEMFSRIANSEFEMNTLSSELEMINCAVQSYISMMEKDSPDYRTVVLSAHPCWRAHMDKEGSIKRLYGHTEIDGNFLYRHIWKVHTSAEEYDRLVQEEPEACRPLLRAAGDLRTGKELEEGHRHDRRVLIGDMCSTEAGTHFLNAFSGELRSRVEPIMRAASLGCLLQEPSLQRPGLVSLDSPPCAGSSPCDSEARSQEGLRLSDEHQEPDIIIPYPHINVGQSPTSTSESSQDVNATSCADERLESFLQTDCHTEAEAWTEAFCFLDKSSSESERDNTGLEKEPSKGLFGENAGDFYFDTVSDPHERTWIPPLVCDEDIGFLQKYPLGLPCP